jgi:predicted dehydrogenase
MFKVGIWGLGLIAKDHVAAYMSLKEDYPIQLVAVCDIDNKAFEEMALANNIKNVNKYNDIDKMLEREKLDIIDICLPTSLHVEAALKMLQKGYHVLLEKPMGLSSAESIKLLDASKKSDKVFMVGQCLRFYPEYQYLKKIIQEKRYGQVLTAYLERLSMTPKRRGENWLLDYERSGGCLFDVHIHDVDIVRYLFGEPKSVSAQARHVLSRYDSVNTRFIYADKQVMALADWTLKPSFGFKPMFRVSFEEATVIYDNYSLKVYREDESFTPNIEKGKGIEREIEYFIKLITKKCENTENRPEDSFKTIELLECIRSSADENGKLVLWA